MNERGASFTAVATPIGQTGFLLHSIPDDPRLIECVGRIAIRHAYLDHELKLTLKTLRREEAKATLKRLSCVGARRLRQMVEREAKEVFGEGETLAATKELLSRCEDASDQRNEVLHSVWAKWYEGAEQLFDGENILPLPTVEVLEKLERTIKGLADELNSERKMGFIAKAMRSGQEECPRA